MIGRTIFWLLMALVVLTPIPFASNRLWAWSLMAAWVGGLLLLQALNAAVNTSAITIPWRHYRFAGCTFFALIAWYYLQTASFTPQAWHHPIWAEAAALLNRPYRGAISVDPVATEGALLRIAAYGGAFWLALQYGGRDRRARQIIWAVILAATLNALYGIAVKLGGGGTILWFEKWGYYHNVTGTFVNRNHFATYLGMALILTLGFLTESLRTALTGVSLRSSAGLVLMAESLTPRMYVLATILCILATALIMTGSRAGLASTAMGILSFLFAFGISGRVSVRRLIRFGLALAVIAVVALSVGGASLVARFERSAANLSERMNVFRDTLQGIADHPFTGTGLGTFRETFLAYRSAAYGASGKVYDYAHNTYLEIAMEGGIPALLLTLLLFAVLLKVLARGMRERHRNETIPACGIGITLLIATHALVDFSIQIPAVALTYFIIAGLAYAQSWRHSERSGYGRDIAAGDRPSRETGTARIQPREVARHVPDQSRE